KEACIHRRHNQGGGQRHRTELGKESKIWSGQRALLGPQSEGRGGNDVSANYACAPHRFWERHKMTNSWPLRIAANDPNDPLFVGVGELPSGRYPQRSFIGDLTRVALLALKDAGMTPMEVDTILLI